MDTLESLRMAWRSIRGHRLRSFLTTLGVIIGVAAVITFVTLGASLQGALIGDVAGQQSPSMTVTAGAGDGPQFGGGQAVFTERDVEQLRTLDGVAGVYPQGDVSLSGLTYRNQTIAYGSLTATTPGYFEQEGRGNFSSGGPFTLGDEEIVINQRAATLFETNVTVGDTVTLARSDGGSTNVTVVGILSGDSGGGMFGGGGPDGQSQPQVYGPVDPIYQRQLESPTTGESQHVYGLVTVVATDFEMVDAVQERVTGYLESDSDARQLTSDSTEFSVQTNEEIIDQIQSILSTLTGFITGIAVISLVVGSIGIANIMLVSVTERTREIGIMKAVGAQKRDILQVFLAEAIILGVIGSGFGVVVGAIAAYVATAYAGIALTFPLEWFGIAIAVGIGVGVLAGLYPAWDAARTDPIDALRYE